MTEVEWLTCDDPTEMLNHLRDAASDRRFRLFGAACCQQVQSYLDPICRAALTIAERYADGLSSLEELDSACADVSQAITDVTSGVQRAPFFVKWLCHREVWLNCGGIARGVADEAAVHQPSQLRRATRRVTLRHASRLVRDVFGNPFRPVAFDPAWRTTDVRMLADGIYAERAFDRMPILADALQDAGCDSDGILDHLRDANATHVRGCWALDLVLGKE
jgi:hypothetical protein